MLRWLKTVVVSDEEKAHWMRQAGTGKASASESLLTRLPSRSESMREAPFMSHEGPTPRRAHHHDAATLKSKPAHQHQPRSPQMTLN